MVLAGGLLGGVTRVAEEKTYFRTLNFYFVNGSRICNKFSKKINYSEHLIEHKTLI